jgi:hypothetical protein
MGQNPYEGLCGKTEMIGVIEEILEHYTSHLIDK